jgi:cytochrome c553
MNYLLAYLPDAYLMRMAEHFASLNPPVLVQPPVQRSPEQVRDGQRIVTQGIPARKIPACVTCHGAELGGREPGIPGLLGLRADYVSAQLGNGSPMRNVSACATCHSPGVARGDADHRRAPGSLYRRPAEGVQVRAARQ